MYSKYRKGLLSDYRTIESQHSAIKEILSQLSASAKAENFDISSTMIALDELQELTDAHFLHEEKVMQLIKYSMACEHLDHHFAFRFEMAFQRSKYLKHDNESIGNFVEFVRIWLDSHDKAHDIPLQEFISETLGTAAKKRPVPLGSATTAP